MKFTEIKISGLREGTHLFQFSLDDHFSEAFSTDFFTCPKLEVEVSLQTSDTIIRAELAIKGNVVLVCDRSLEEFTYPVSENVTHFFKYGEEEKELSDEIDMISQERISLDFDQLVYDIVALSLPQKKLHPRFSDETAENDEEGLMVYSSGNSEGETENDENDPRWDILKNLN